jgi:hypothetical protein
MPLPGITHGGMDPSPRCSVPPLVNLRCEAAAHCLVAIDTRVPARFARMLALLERFAALQAIQLALLRPGQATPFTASFKLLAPAVHTPIDRAPLLGASFDRATLLGAAFDAQLIALMRAPLNALLRPAGALSAELTGMRSRGGRAPQRRCLAHHRPALKSAGARCVGPHGGAAGLSAAHLATESGTAAAAHLTAESGATTATTASAALTTLRVRLGDWRRGDNN